jgi:hypothetical protein
MSATFESFRIDHVYREHNSEADALANEALDETSGRSKPATATPDKSDSSNPRPRALEDAPSKLRARVKSGGLHFASPLDLPEDTEVEILLRLAPKR